MNITILKHVLKNSLDFDQANSKVVLGLVLKDNPELKKDVPKLLKEIETMIKDNQLLSKEEIKDKLQELAPELLKEKKIEIKGPLKPLPNAKKGKVIVRIAPSPSGPLHIGHAYGASLNYEYAKMYDGQLILRIEDTNPEKIYPPAYELIEDDTKWLTDNKLAKVVIQSDRLGIYYDYAEKLVQKGYAYVCTCDPDEWRTLKNNGKTCSCRNLGEQSNRYSKMFSSYAEGEAVLRAKTNIQHKNPAMRDFAIMRIVEHIHPRTGKEQRVWPLMVFSVAVDDHELGITHVLNGKDQMDNAEKEKAIMKSLGWQPPEYQHWGKINFDGFRLKTSEVKVAIEQKEYSGWDDIRLPFLGALRKRGYQAGAFRKFATEIGLSLTDKNVSQLEFWKSINAFNRDIIEPKASRYFFVNEPKEIQIRNLESKEVEISLHPNFKDRGNRKLNVSDRVYISDKDFKTLAEGYTHRLMDLCNIEVKGNIVWKESDHYEDYKNAENKGKIIHWVPVEENKAVEILLDTGSILKGYGEISLQNCKEGDIIQFERFAFCRINKKEKNKIILWYLHK
ncbi:MAG TPA: glutamate--tRNA ligase [Candidatus Nanoarchaeia archaeon]|nr:glutamate--tRNA ligase [Candidatus Nanoarchaeia archaeon]